MPAGRPPKYKRKYCKEIIEFFDIEAVKETMKTITTKNGTVIEEEGYLPNKLPTLVGFARKIGVVKQTLHNWASEHPEFLVALTRAKEMAEEIWIENSLLGLYNPRFSQFYGINCMGYKNNINHEHTGKDGGPIEQSIVNMPPSFKTIDEWVAWKKKQELKPE